MLGAQASDCVLSLGVREGWLGQAATVRSLRCSHIPPLDATGQSLGGA